MEIKEIQAAIEAILFVSGDSVSVDRISEVLEADKAIVTKLIVELSEKLESEESGINIVKIGDKYQLCSKAIYANYVRKIMDIRKNVPLSPAAMEVLAIVAYNQPVTKAFVEQIRGVDCSGVLGSLTTKDLIEEKGRLELPGRPLLYGTTDNFLRSFEISCLDELPKIPKTSDDENNSKNEENFDTDEKV